MKVPELILALDTDSPGEIGDLLKDLAPLVSWVKVGYQAICSLGLPAIIEFCAGFGYKIFVDLKFHDNPSTVARNVQMLCQYEIDMLNVHTMGGATMMQKAKQAAESCAFTPKVLGVTVLTSHVMSQRGVVKLATNAEEASLDGVICSPLEVEAIRTACSRDFLIITPGIRPLWAPAGDQKRYATPIEMTRLGADYIVVGRPILRAKDPVKATELILQELNAPM